jgi:shikimate dehydrogenase
LKAALIGQGIGASLTPVMHEAEARAQSFEYRYERFDTAHAPYADMPLEDLISKAEQEGYAGLNITHPYKTRAAGLVDELSGPAKELGVINTIVFKGGKRIGYNTDYTGFGTAFRHEFNGVVGERVLLLGAGGAGLAVALALIDHPVEKLTVFDRLPKQALALVNRLAISRPCAQVSVISSIHKIETSEVDGVVNATPMGMADYPGVAINPDFLTSSQWVFDIVYFPQETELLLKAKQRGCRVVSGVSMAVFQAAAAFSLITGKAADPARMATVFEPISRANQIQNAGALL